MQIFSYENYENEGSKTGSDWESVSDFEMELPTMHPSILTQSFFKLYPAHKKHKN